MSRFQRPAHRTGARLRLRAAGGLLLGAALASSCRNLDRFDTGPSGAYCGTIIDGAFTRRGFSTGLGLRLTLDIAGLQSAPGSLSTDDAASGPCSPSPLFDQAALVVTPELFADPLSLLEFGASREDNFIAWVDSTCQGSALAFVSLMHTGDVEVRLLARGSFPDAVTPGDFGVFQLRRTDCEF